MYRAKRAESCAYFRPFVRSVHRKHRVLPIQIAAAPHKLTRISSRERDFPHRTELTSAGTR